MESNWFEVAESAPGRFTVDSNADESAFRSLFRLDVSFEAMASALVSCGPELAEIVETLPGLRVLQPSCVRETFFCFICTANNHLSRIGQMVRRLAAFGPLLAEREGLVLSRFPSLERIASIPEAALRQAGFGYRGKTIPIAAGQLLERRQNWLESLRDAPYLDARHSLTEIYGIGPKLADCIALYGLHKLEATPIDTHMWQALCRVYFPEWRGQPLTEKRYRESAAFLRDRFGEWAGAAHLFLYYENLRNWRTRVGPSAI